MEFDPSLWPLLPVSILVATVAMASGVGGAVFFSPIFLLWLQLEPAVAVGAALLTELFGFTSGLVAYVRQRLIDYRLGGNLLLFSIPGALLGVVLADLIPPVALKAVFAAGLVFIGLQLFVSWRSEQREKHEANLAEEETGESSLVDRSGRKFVYTVCNKSMGRLFAAVGGAFLSMISVGLAELQEYHLVAKCRVPSPVAVATSIFVVVVTVLVASIGHAVALTQEGGDRLGEVLAVVVFTAPGVLIGGQIGPRLQSRIDPDQTKVAISILFCLIGGFMFWTLAHPPVERVDARPGVERSAPGAETPGEGTRPVRPEKPAGNGGR